MKIRLTLLCALLLVGCQTLPVVRALPPSDAGQRQSCPSIFPEVKTRYIHALEAHAAGKPRAMMIGVTVVDPASQALQCALVSAEGLTLLEAEWVAGALSVSRALPPLDSPDFVNRMMQDIALIFLAPEGERIGPGVLPDGRRVCRFGSGQPGWVDVSSAAGGPVFIERYSSGQKRLRKAAVVSDDGGAYAAIALESFEGVGYLLKMTRLEVESMTDTTVEIPMEKKGNTP